MRAREMTVLLGALGFVLSAFATDYVWINTGVNAPSTAHSFADTANWNGGVVPVSGTSTYVWFTNTPGAVRYATIPDSFQFYEVYGAIGSPIVLIGDNVNVHRGLNYKGSGSTPTVYLYADSTITKDMYLNRAVVCGDITRTGSYTLWQSAGDNWHRLDFYANAAGETRVNPSTTYNLSLSYGTYHMIAPQGSDEAITATWTLSNGSPYAVRASGTAEHVLCAGTLVTAANDILPVGTFLKRVFPDGSIELSQPAALGSATADVALTFEAFSPKVSQSLQFLNTANSTAHTLDFSKWREKDEARLCVDSMNWTYDSAATRESTRLVLTSWTGVPATIEIVDSARHNCNIVLDKCHLQFEKPTSGNAGFPQASLRMASASSVATLTVTNGITAYVGSISNVIGSLVKNGAGTLVATVPSYTAAGALANTGSLTVEGGIFEALAPDGTDAMAVANLAIGASATLKIPTGSVFTVTSSFSAGAGATISGAGTVVLPNGLSDAAGVTFADGASVLVVQSNGQPIYEQPNGLAPAGTPAFWVDASQGVVESSGNITRWNDVRGAGYMFATNVASVYPTLETDNQDRKFIKIARVAEATKTDIASTAALVWDRPLSNIRTVLMVVDLYDGGGAWLGSSPRISTHDYWREAGWKYWNQVMGGLASGHVMSGKIYMNGETIPATGTGCPYAGYAFTATNYKKGDVSCPICVEFVPTGDTEADAFGFCNYQNGCNGQMRIYEYVIYTNALTTAERLETEEYLMKKWMNAHANYDRLGEVPDRMASLNVSTVPAVAVAVGDLVAIDSVTGDGTLAKTGAGTLYVEDLVDADTAIDVREGVFNLRSVKTTADTLPSTPWVHFDASDLSTLTAATNNDLVTVTEMRDRRGAAYPKAIMKVDGDSVQLNETAGVGGLTMLDFGPYSSTHTENKSMKFQLNGVGAYNEEIHTTISVVGTVRGGGVLVGGSSARGSNITYHDLDGLYRADPGSYSSPIVSSSPNRPSPGMMSSGHAGARRSRLNGNFMVPTTTGFSGGYDLVSLCLYDCFGASGIACCHYGHATGGMEFGEQMLFEEVLSREQVLNVEAYLRRKWFGADEPAYRGSRAKSLAVARGATVNVYGDSPFVVGSISGRGIVNGPVALAPGGTLDVVVNNGTVTCASAPGLDLDAGGVVAFSGELRGMKGRVTLIEGVSHADGALANWSATIPRQGYSVVVGVADGNLVADIFVPGSILIVR
ncbi:MAG: hypothetical protein IJG84_01115 [Kiritimatiellae bacterium]|nr:hypothetical protein [Kiritimatiellia bacterium]